MKFIYFAYGSNMLTERLRARCPSAEPVDTAEVRNFTLEFNKPSTDGSGKANIRHDTENNSLTYGVLFEIHQDDQPSLDVAEGVGYGYMRCNSLIVNSKESAEHLTATSYIATKTNNELGPYDWYLALIIAGASQHNLPPEYIAWLSRCSYIFDKKTDRNARLAAISALRKYGISKYINLLAETR